MPVRCDSDSSRSSYLTVKSFRVRYSKLRTPVMRTRSPSTSARGITATSGRHGRSCEGGIEIHHATTPKNKAIAVRLIHRRLERKNANMVKAAKAAANVKRSAAHGRFE